jgi:hypothetical protein
MVNINCQSIADDITTAEGIRNTIRATLSASPTPQDLWTRLAEIGVQNREIARLQGLLDDCQRRWAAAYEAEVVVYDLAPGPTPPRQARLWLMDGGVPTVIETVPVTGTTLQFVTRMDRGPFGLTIEDPSVPGMDFRSGPVMELYRNSPQDPSGRIEIVVGPQVTFTEGDLNEWVGGVSLPQQTTIATADPGVSIELTLANLSVNLKTAGRISLAASGTAAVTAAALGSQLAPFTLEVPLSIGLPVTPDLGRICDLLVRGVPKLTADGPVGAILESVSNVVRDFAAAQALPIVGEALNRVLTQVMADIFGLDVLPEGAVPSLRGFDIQTTGVTLTATLGTFGDALSTYKP